jgi:hypothetical protein
MWFDMRLQIVGAGARDSDANVRGQAMFALGELAGNCQPEMSAHAREALPHVFSAMAEDNPKLQQQACYALDSFCEHLGDWHPLQRLLWIKPTVIFLWGAQGKTLSRAVLWNLSLQILHLPWQYLVQQQ